MHFPTSVVMYPAMTWYATPETKFHAPTPDGLLDPDRWVELVVAYGAKWQERDGVVIVRAGGDLGAAGRSHAATAFLGALNKAGWNTNHIGSETGWFTCRRHNRTPGSIMFGVLPWMDQSRTTLFSLGDSADNIAFRLAQYERLTGAVWRGTAGLSGTGLLRGMFPAQRQPRWRWDKIPREIHGRSFELLGAHNNRPPADGEGPFVHVYDTRAMYLAGALVAELAWDGCEQRGPQEFDPARPGYWRISMDDPAVRREPNHARLLRPQGAGALVWVTTPVMQYLTERVGPVEVFDSVTAGQSSRVMRGWAERLRDARVDAPPEILPAIKDTYSRTVGMLRRPGGRVFRPDWRDTVVDKAKVNMIRKVDKAGVDPLRWNVDAVWVPSPDETAPDLFNDSGRIGGLHHVGSMTMDEYKARFNIREKV